MSESSLVRDANSEIIPQQYYDEASQTYKVPANGDTTGVDFSKKSLLRDANLEIIPSQYYDVNLGAFVIGTLPTGGGSGGTATQGPPGVNGKSAYELAQDDGFIGTETEWRQSLVGAQGPAGIDGVDGKSAFELAQDNGFTGTLYEWFQSLKGKDADLTTVNESITALVTSSNTQVFSEEGAHGLRFYNNELSIKIGEEWRIITTGGTGSGETGADGKSAYELALENGFVGDVTTWLTSLKGERGEPGKDGVDGKDGADATLLLPLPASEIAQTSELQLISGVLKALIQTNKTDIESIIQRFAQIEQDLQNAASADEFVKGDANDTPGYLSEKIDGVTLKWINQKLVVENIAGLMADISELNALVGINGNVQAQLDAMMKVVNPKEIFPIKTDLPALPNDAYPQSITVLVQSDADYEGATTFYISTGTDWQYVNKINSDVLRDFLNNPLNINTETYDVLSKDRYEKQNASETPFTDPTGTLQSTNTNDAIVELLRLADSAKTLIVNAIGFPLSRTDSFEQMSVKLLNIKRSFVDLLIAKGVAASEHNTLQELVNKLLSIPNIEIEAGVKRTSKLTVNAPYSHQIVLNEPLQPRDVTVSVIEFIPGQQGQLHYVMNFDSADRNRLVMTDETELTGVLKLKDKYEINLSEDATYTGEGKLYTATVNKSDFTSITSVMAKVRE